MFSDASLISFEAFTLSLFLLIILFIMGIIFFRSQTAKAMNRNILGIIIAVYGIVMAILLYRIVVFILIVLVIYLLFGWWQ